MIYILLAIVIMLVVMVVGYMNLPKFGRAAKGERLARIENSPNYRDGMFHNQQSTPQITSDKSRMRVMFDFLFEKRERNRPQADMPAIKTDLKAIEKDREALVWFGHSSYLIQSSGKRILVDPVFVAAAPVSFLNRPFKGTEIYSPEDMPDIDYMIITHDHWDHLDYATVVALKDRVAKVICPLGVGEHLEYWGYAPNQIVELDWNEQVAPDSGFMINCLPSRHFSGRTFKSNQTLWASYMVETPTQTIYISGDGGYGVHLADIAKRFPHIDLAIMENGQYNENWRYIHFMPEDLVRAVKELNAKNVVTVHHSKYALSKHPWDEPLQNARNMATHDSLPILMPTIGEVVNLY